MAAILPTALPAPAAAQGSLRFEPGTRMRVTLRTASRSIVATLVDVRRDTLVLGRPEMAVETTIPLPATLIRKLEISTGRRSLAAHGAVGGLVLGVVVTAIHNGIVSSQCFPPRPCADSYPVWLGGLIGGGIGGLSFAFLRSEQWREIALPRTPLGPGTSVGLSHVR
jgi:hypothetical protein